MRTRLVHGTCVALDGTGVLLLGGAGSGKSDLALRLIDGGARLVADDQVSITARDAQLVAAAPEAIAGRIEICGVGIVAIEGAVSAVLGMAVDLVAGAEMARLPDPRRWECLGVAVPMFALAPLEASAATKLRFAVRQACMNHGVADAAAFPAGTT